MYFLYLASRIIKCITIFSSILERLYQIPSLDPIVTLWRAYDLNAESFRCIEKSNTKPDSLIKLKWLTWVCDSLVSASAHFSVSLSEPSGTAMGN